MALWAQIRELDAERESLDVPADGVEAMAMAAMAAVSAREDAGTEGDWLPVVLGEESYFFGGPARLRGLWRGLCLCLLIRGFGVE